MDGACQIVDLPQLQATEQLALRIAPLLLAGDALLLEGPLGAGKTAFARALLRATCGDPALEVPSPSYTLVQTYEGPAGPLHHFDLWRLDGPESLHELGWEDARAGIVLVEWPDRLGPLRPAEALTLRFEVLNGDHRRVMLTGWSGRLAGAGLAAVSPGRHDAPERE